MMLREPRSMSSDSMLTRSLVISRTTSLGSSTAGAIGTTCGWTSIAALPGAGSPRAGTGRRPRRPRSGGGAGCSAGGGGAGWSAGGVTGRATCAFLSASKMRVMGCGRSPGGCRRSSGTAAAAFVDGGEHRQLGGFLGVPRGSYRDVETVDEEGEADADDDAERRRQADAHVVALVARGGRRGRAQ